jgi:hypothetical protein
MSPAQRSIASARLLAAATGATPPHLRNPRLVSNAIAPPPLFGRATPTLDTSPAPCEAASSSLAGKNPAHAAPQVVQHIDSPARPMVAQPDTSSADPADLGTVGHRRKAFQALPKRSNTPEGLSQRREDACKPSKSAALDKKDDDVGKESIARGLGVKVLTAKQAAAAKSKARALKPKEQPVCPFDTSFMVECLEKLTPLSQVCFLLVSLDNLSHASSLFIHIVSYNASKWIRIVLVLCNLSLCDAPHHTRGVIWCSNELPCAVVCVLC